MSANTSLAEMALYRTERPILISQGITDYDQQCAVLKRRWGAMKTIMDQDVAAQQASAANTGNVVPFGAPLSDADCKDMGLRLRRVDASDPQDIKYM